MQSPKVGSVQWDSSKEKSKLVLIKGTINSKSSLQTTITGKTTLERSSKPARTDMLKPILVFNVNETNFGRTSSGKALSCVKMMKVKMHKMDNHLLVEVSIQRLCAKSHIQMTPLPTAESFEYTSHPHYISPIYRLQLFACDSGHTPGNGFDKPAKPADRPERRTALVARELARYNIDIAALSETRLANVGQLTETGGGYTFLWSGRGSDERRDAGVGFAVRSHLVRKLASLPKDVNDQLMTLHLPLQNRSRATLISTYAPTINNPGEMKDKFYEELDALLSAVSSTDKLILPGDFNARVGCDSAISQGVVGRHGVGKCNSNGLLLMKTCAAHALLITNTTFHLPTRNKTSWIHPRSKHWHLIDYVIVRRKDRQDVRVTKAMCGADCWTDHRLIVSKMRLRIRPKRRPQGSKVMKRINVAKLKNSSIASALAEDLETKLADLHLAERDQILQRWAEHFEAILNRLSSINDEAIDRIPQVDMNSAMDDPPVVAEVTKAVSQLSSGKAPGADAIPAEIYKAAGPVLIEKLIELLQSFWKQGSIPQELKDASIVHLYKRKGNRQIKGQKLQAVDQFTYLGSTLSPAVTIDTEVNYRIAKASSAFGRLHSTVWERRGISPATKLKVYSAVVLTALLYACEMWTVYRRHARQLNHFHMTCLRRILRIRWQDKVPDTEVLSGASLPSVHTLLMRAQTRWAGHVIRMLDERIPKQLLFGELSAGRHSHGGQKKRYKGLP
ncbi:uncharacterized protein LOC144503067 [Mustelus asterias]